MKYKLKEQNKSFIRLLIEGIIRDPALFIWLILMIIGFLKILELLLKYNS